MIAYEFAHLRIGCKLISWLFHLDMLSHQGDEFTEQGTYTTLMFLLLQDRKWNYVLKTSYSQPS